MPLPHATVTRFNADNADIRARFKAEFVDESAATENVRVIWENGPFDKTDELNPFPALAEEYVRLVIRQTIARQVGTGRPRRFRSYGVVGVQIQTKYGGGTGRNEKLADLVGRALGAVTNGGIVFRTPTYKQIGADGQWYRAVMSVQYESTFDDG